MKSNRKPLLFGLWTTVDHQVIVKGLFSTLLLVGTELGFQWEANQFVWFFCCLGVGLSCFSTLKELEKRLELCLFIIGLDACHECGIGGIIGIVDWVARPGGGSIIWIISAFIEASITGLELGLAGKGSAVRAVAACVIVCSIVIAVAAEVAVAACSRVGFFAGNSLSNGKSSIGNSGRYDTASIGAVSSDRWEEDIDGGDAFGAGIGSSVSAELTTMRAGGSAGSAVVSVVAVGHSLGGIGYLVLGCVGGWCVQEVKQVQRVDGTQNETKGQEDLAMAFWRGQFRNSKLQREDVCHLGARCLPVRPVGEHCRSESASAVSPCPATLKRHVTLRESFPIGSV